MGGERNRTGKYLYLSIAPMIFIFIAGCATLKEMEVKREAREHLVRAQERLDQGDYEGALKESRKVLSLYNHVPLGDEALFNVGLIYAHHGFINRDDQKSLDHFNRLVTAFPQSPLAWRAKIWIGILKENERLNREIIEARRNSMQGYERLRTEIEELNETVLKSKQENERLNKRIEELNKTIQKSKQVDIEIDEKKKELSK